MIKIKEVMSANPICIDKDAKLTEAIKLMEKHDVGRLLVVEDDRLVGIVTDRDIALRLANVKYGKLTPSRLHVSSVMTPNPITIDPESTITDAARMMLENGVSGLPVVDRNGDLIGIVTKTDLIKPCMEGTVCPAVFYQSLVREAMTPNPITVSPWDKVIHARRIMLDENVSRLPVVDEGRLVGIITERDIAFAMASFRRVVPDRYKPSRIKRLLVEDIMTRSVVTASPDELCSDVAKKFLEGGFSGCPVIEEESLVGIITKTDLIKLLL